MVSYFAICMIALNVGVIIYFTYRLVQYVKEEKLKASLKALPAAVVPEDLDEYEEFEENEPEEISEEEPETEIEPEIHDSLEEVSEMKTIVDEWVYHVSSDSFTKEESAEPVQEIPPVLEPTIIEEDYLDRARNKRRTLIESVDLRKQLPKEPGEDDENDSIDIKAYETFLYKEEKTDRNETQLSQEKIQSRIDEYIKNKNLKSSDEDDLIIE